MTRVIHVMQLRIEVFVATKLAAHVHAHVEESKDSDEITAEIPLDKW